MHDMDVGMPSTEVVARGTREALIAAMNRAEAAEARVAELEAALRPFASFAEDADSLGHGPGSACPWRLEYDDLATARDALKGEHLDG